MQVSTTHSPMHHMERFNQVKLPASSSRILYDIPCKVCRDHSSGKHYGIFACDGCAGFFKRSIRRNRQYVCKSKKEGACVIDKTHRNQCRACRLTKCIDVGMNKDAVQHERGPRNATLRRQMTLFYKDPASEVHAEMMRQATSHMSNLHNGVLDLAMPKLPIQMPLPQPLSTPPALFCNPALLKLSMGIPFAPVTSLPTVESICENAAQLLFMNVTWAKSVPPFLRLPVTDQLILLEESWRELFVLGAAQFLMPLDFNLLLRACEGFSSNRNQIIPLLHEVNLFRETLGKFVELQVDTQEYECLRSIALFKNTIGSSSQQSSGSSNNSSPVSNSDNKTLQEGVTVAFLQEQSRLSLTNYIRVAKPNHPNRFGQLLMFIPSLRDISNNTIEELFFRRTIHNIPIEKIICDMYKGKT